MCKYGGRDIWEIPVLSAQMNLKLLQKTKSIRKINQYNHHRKTDNRGERENKKKHFHTKGSYRRTEECKTQRKQIKKTDVKPTFSANTLNVNRLNSQLKSRVAK